MYECFFRFYAYNVFCICKFFLAYVRNNLYLCKRFRQEILKRYTISVCENVRSFLRIAG